MTRLKKTFWRENCASAQCSLSEEVLVHVVPTAELSLERHVESARSSGMNILTLTSPHVHIIASA